MEVFIKRFFFSIMLVLFPVSSFSQYEKRNIKLSPFSLLDEVSFPAIQVGYEKSLNERFSFYNEVGIRYMKSLLENSDTSFIQGSGFRMKSEIRYYFPKSFGYEEVKTVLNGLYLAANVFYKRDFHSSEITYHPGKDSLLIATDDFAVKKNILGINLLIGLQKKLVNHFCFDIYFGFGYRYRFIKDLFMKYDAANDGIIKPAGFDIRTMMNETDLKNGTSSTPSATFGLRIGYRF